MCLAISSCKMETSSSFLPSLRASRIDLHSFSNALPSAPLPNKHIFPSNPNNFLPIFIARLCTFVFPLACFFLDTYRPLPLRKKRSSFFLRSSLLIFFIGLAFIFFDAFSASFSAFSLLGDFFLLGSELGELCFTSGSDSILGFSSLSLIVAVVFV